jgi:hypothetical protein
MFSVLSPAVSLAPSSPYLRSVYRYKEKRAQLLIVYSSRALLKPALPDDKISHGSRAAALIGESSSIDVYWDETLKAFTTENPIISPRPV